MMPKKRLSLILALSALCCGLILYVLLREETYIAKLFRCIPLVTEVQNKLNCCSNAFLKYYLSDFLWAFSLCCALHYVYPTKRWIGWICAGITSGAGILWEGMQYYGIVSGTGDILDGVAYLLAGLLATTILKEKRK